MKKIYLALIALFISFAPLCAQEKGDSVAPAAAASAVIPQEVLDVMDQAREYCAQSFLDMTQNDLEKFKMLLADKDFPQVLALRDTVSETLSLWHEIDGYKRLLYVPFQYDKVRRARERIYLMQDEMPPAQYEVIYEKIDSPLSHYYHGVKFFQEVLITQFNESVDAARKERNMSEVRSKFEALLKQPEVKQNIETRILTVPWLEKKFQDYRQYILNRNSSPRGPVAQEIMKISLTPQ